MRLVLQRLLPHNTTSAWLWLMAITVMTLALAIAERGLLPWVGWLVAALIWLKAWLVAVHYLEVAKAGKVFGGIVRVFIAIAPLALIATAWMEAH